jgi:hypothetical protein
VKDVVAFPSAYLLKDVRSSGSFWVKTEGWRKGEEAQLIGEFWCAQGRNVVLESKYGSPRIVNDGVTVAKEVELEDPVENIGAKLVRQVSSGLHI